MQGHLQRTARAAPNQKETSGNRYILGKEYGFPKRVSCLADSLDLLPDIRIYIHILYDIYMYVYTSLTGL